MVQQIKVYAGHVRLKKYMHWGATQSSAWHKKYL